MDVGEAHKVLVDGHRGRLSQFSLGLLMLHIGNTNSVCFFLFKERWREVRKGIWIVVRENWSGKWGWA